MFSEVLHGLVGRTQRDAGVDQNQPGPRWCPAPPAHRHHPGGYVDDVGLCPLGEVGWRALSTGRWVGGLCPLGAGAGGVCPLGAGAGGLCPLGEVDGRLCPLGGWEWAELCHWGLGWTESAPGREAWRPGLSAGGTWVSASVHYAGGRRQALPTGQAGCRVSRSAHQVQAGRAARGFAFQVHLVCSHLSHAPGVGPRLRRKGLPSSLGTRFPPGGGGGQCSQRAGRWWWVGSGGPEHSGGDGDGERAAWKKQLVPGAGAGWGPRGVRWLASRGWLAQRVP